MIPPEPPSNSDDDALLAHLRAAALPVRRPDAAADAPAPDAQPAVAIPGFTLVRELQRGGQGAVWQARQQEPPRDVALKLLHARARASPQARHRFEREAELAARLHHPNVVTVYASGCADGVPWCAMELVDGVPLDEWLRTHELPRRARLELFVQIARAVGHAHQRGVLHRDLKPANVLIDRAGAPHVLDFGIARALAPEPSAAGADTETEEGEFVGTLAYAAPEQVAGDPGAVDTRTDVHALGVILFEMVTGALPYDTSGGLAAAVERIAHAPPRRARDVDRTVARALDAVIAVALEKEPQRRYATAEALAADVDHLLQGEPVTACGQSPWYLLGRVLVRHRRRVAALLAGLLLLGTCTFLLLRERIVAAQSARIAAEVRALLRDLIEAARPDRMGGSVPLPEILEAAAGRLDVRLGEVPDVRAELLLAIGETYQRLQRPEDAQPHLRAALEQARRAGAPLLIASCLHALGRALGDADEAATLLGEALQLRERALGATSGAAAETRSALAAALADSYRAPDQARAEALQRQALAELHAAYATNESKVAEIARAQVRLAQVCASRGAHDEAQTRFEEAQQLLARARPAAPDLEVEALHASASFLQGRGRFDEAQARLERALELTRAHFGEERVPEMLRAFARLHFARGDLASSERVSRQALGEELARWLRRRPDVAPDLAPLVAQLADAAVVEPPWAAAFARLRELRGDGAYEVAGWMNGIALLCQRQQKNAVAEELLRGSLRFHCRVWGDDCPMRLRALELLADLLLERDVPAEALALVDEADGILARTGAPADERARRVDPRRAKCRRAMGGD